MNILITAVSRFEKPSGICRSAASLANSLVLHPDVTQVYLVVGSWQVDYFRENFRLEFDRIEVVSIDIKNSPIARNWWYLSSLPALAKELGCSLVHLSYPVPVLRSLFSAHVVSTVHDLYPFEIPENFGYPQVYFNQLFTKLCLTNCEGVTCVSGYTLQQFKKYFPKYRKPTTLVYAAIEFKNVQPYPPKQLSGAPFILSVAQHRKNKNLDLLIRAFYEIRSTGKIYPNTSLVIVGSNASETENLHQLVNELGIVENVIFLSSLADSELVWLYQKCHMMILPSSVEGFGLPVVEALYYSCRVICSDIPTLREVGGTQCAFFSLEGNAIENLKQTILQVWKSPEPVSIKDLRFDEKSISNQYVAFYKKLSAGSQETHLTQPAPAV